MKEASKGGGGALSGEEAAGGDWAWGPVAIGCSEGSAARLGHRHGLVNGPM